jgi:uncharacterized protein YjdB
VRNRDLAFLAGYAAIAVALFSLSCDLAGNKIHVESVTLNDTSESIVVGGTCQLIATISPSDSTDTSVGWSCSNGAVASVSAAGLVTGVAPGTATVTVTTTDGDRTATCAVTVTDSVVHVTGVTLKSTTTLSPGGTEQLVAMVSPANATNKDVLWSSSNSGVATVSTTGLLTGVAEGSTEVTVITADGGKSAACWVNVSTVTVHPNSVSLNKSSTSLAVDETEQLTATIDPTNATNQNLTWSSSNSAVATVSSTGLVTGKSINSATITVTTVDRGKTATCAVSVSAAVVHVVSVSLDQSSLDMIPTQTAQLVATVLPANATDNSVTWSSSNSGVASVSASGLVTAEAAGSATITVTTMDGGKTATCAVLVASGPPTILYVAEDYSHQVSVFNHADTASGTGTAADRTLSYSGFSQLAGVRRDTTRNILYVLSWTGGIVYVFDNADTASGNTTPNRTIYCPDFYVPSSFQLDQANDRLYVASYADGGTNSLISVFNSASTLNGTVAADRTISGAGVASVWGIFLDTDNNRLYAALAGDPADGGSNSSIAVFNNASTVNGAATPTRTISATEMSPYLTTVCVDTTRNILYATGYSGYIQKYLNADSISGAVTPDAAFSCTWSATGLFIDAAKDMLFVSESTGYVAVPNSFVTAYDSASTLTETASPNRTFGSLTGPAGLWGE